MDFGKLDGRCWCSGAMASFGSFAKCVRGSNKWVGRLGLAEQSAKFELVRKAVFCSLVLRMLEPFPRPVHFSNLQ